MAINFKTNDKKALAECIAESIGGTLESRESGFRITTAFDLNEKGCLSFSDNVPDAVVEGMMEKVTEAGFEFETELVVSMPRAMFTEQTFSNIDQLLKNKGALFKSAFQTDSLEYTVGEETVDFAWFTVQDYGDADAYTKFISAMVKMANEKKINRTQVIYENQKYAFRVFLMRLGFVGDAYKRTRKVLLRNLTGSSAFRDDV